MPSVALDCVVYNAIWGGKWIFDSGAMSDTWSADASLVRHTREVVGRVR